MQYSPICLFVFNRLDHLKSTLDSLRSCPESVMTDLIIYSDGPKKDSDIAKIEIIRNYLAGITGFKKVIIVNSEKNIGLANSIIFGVSEVLKSYESVIVMEDDLVVSPIFLSYMNSALSFYKQLKDVISIHGYSCPIASKKFNYFLKGADCWGWATWSDRWSLFERDGKILMEKLKRRDDLCDFEFNFTYPFLDMLKGQIEGRNNSWAIRWYASAFLLNKYTLYPAESLVKNIGLDGSGQHCEDQKVVDQVVSIDCKVLSFSNNISENKLIRKEIEKYYFSIRGVRGKILCLVKQFLNSI